MKAYKTDKADQKDILLINPPFGSINGPAISLPVLVSYLLKQGINVSAIDLSNRFYGALLTVKNIQSGLSHIEKRFVELNPKKRLLFSEMVEYEKIVNLFGEKEKFSSEFNELLSNHADLEYIRKENSTDFVSLLIQLTTIKNFPEIIEFAPRLKKTNHYGKYASADLIEATCDRNFYTRIFEEILYADLLDMDAPPLVGISVSFNDQVIPAFQCAGIIKKKWPDTHITLGGSFVSIHFREISNPRIFEAVDSLVLDEGEVPLERLCREILSGKPNLRSIPNLITCRDGKICHTKQEPHPKGQLSFTADYSLFDLEHYLFSPDNIIIPFCLSRGCKWRKCAFCRTDIPVFHNYCRPSPQALYEQLVALVRKHGAKIISFSSAFSEPEVLEHISKRLLEDKIHIRWVASTRLSNDFTKDLCALFRDAGCVRLSFGIESFSDRILALMKKGIHAKQIEKVITGIDGVIPLFLLMIVGFPTETEREARDGFEKLQYFMGRKLITGYNYNVFNMTYGSDIWNNPQKYHITDIHWLNENDLFPNVVYFDSPGMSREKVAMLCELFRSNSGKENITEVKSPGKKVLLRYDLEKIRNIIQTAQIDYLDVCYGKWLQANKDIELRPNTGTG